MIVQMGEGFRLVDGTVSFKNSKLPPSCGVTLERDLYKINKDGERSVEKTSYFHIHLQVLPTLLLAAKTIHKKILAKPVATTFEDFHKIHNIDITTWKSFYDFGDANLKKVPECKFRIDKDTFLIGQVVNLHKMTIDSITLERSYPTKDNPEEKSVFAISFPYNLFESFYFGLCAIAARRKIECAKGKE